MVKKDKEQIVDKFIKDYSKIGVLDNYILAVDFGIDRIEIKDKKGKVVSFMEYNYEDKSIRSTEIAGSKIYNLMKKFLKDYYDIKGLK